MKGIQDFICVDLETTGLNPKNDRIIEIGIVKVREGKVADTYSCMLDPRQKLSKRIEEITGIHGEELEGKALLSDVIHDIYDFMGEDMLVGHRVLFDYSFLKRAFTNVGLPFERKGIDTLWLARKLVQDCKSKSLPSLCEHYGIMYIPHRALSDAMATVELYNLLTEKYYEEEIFMPRQLIYKTKKESPITKPQREQLARLIEKHSLIPEKEIASMTRNEAGRYIDKILSTYGRE